MGLKRWPIDMTKTISQKHSHTNLSKDVPKDVSTVRKHQIKDYSKLGC